MPRTVIIGGGVAGLATAGLLAKEGHQVTVLEKNQDLGGRAGTFSDDGFRFETGPSWYLMPEAYDHFFQLMGSSAEQELDLTTLDPAYRVFEEPREAGKPGIAHDIHHGQARIAEFFESLEPGAGRKVLKYLRSAEEATDLAFKKFLYNPFTRLYRVMGAQTTVALPRLIPQMGGTLKRFVHAQFAHPLLRQILEFPAVFLGTDPKSAPAMYHMMSHLDLSEGVQYPTGGFRAIVDAMVRLGNEAGVEFITEAEATEITLSEDGVQRQWLRLKKPQVTGVSYQDAAGTQHHISADHVVSAADLHHTENHLIPETLREHSQQWWDQRAVSGPSAVLIMLGVRGELPELAHHSLFFASDWSEQFRAIFGEGGELPDELSVYVCKPSDTDDVAPDGDENLFVLIPAPADTALGAGGRNGDGDPAVEAIAERVITQIGEWAGIENFGERVAVRHTVGPQDFAQRHNLWRGGALGPAHTLGQSAMFRTQNMSSKISGLFFAGSSVAPGIGVPMCLISAELVLKRLRGDHSAEPLPIRETA